MKLPSFGFRLIVLVLLGRFPSLAQGQLWIVDDDGGPAADFVEIQLAINAALDGDTVLVRSGTYGGFTIDGKSLIVTGSGEVSVGSIGSLLSVKNLTAAQEVTVRGMQVGGGCSLLQNDGPVWLEFLTLKPAAACGVGWWGARVEECTAVITSHCSFGGAYAGAANGINAMDSSLYLYETDSSGGGSGAAGVHVTDSFLFASGGTFKGGCGTEGGECTGPGGKGGPGLRRVGGPTPQLLETVLIGGPGGCDVGCGACGPPGDPAVGGYDLVAGFARDYHLTSPGVGGQTTTLAYGGMPGDLVFSLIGLSQSALYVPELAGALVLPIPPLLIAHGPAVTGQLQVVVTLPPLPAGFEAFTVYAQGAAVSSIGAAVLAAPSQLTIL